jgi:hypothetical protein
MAANLEKAISKGSDAAFTLQKASRGHSSLQGLNLLM